MNYFNGLPNDAIIYIALTLDLPEILTYCRLSSRFNNIVCENKNFWVRRLKQDYNINYLDIGTRNPKIYYQFFASSKNNNINLLLVNAMEKSRANDIAKYLLRLDDHRGIDYNLVSIFAGDLGDMDVINTILERGGNINRVLLGAIRSKHFNLIDRLIERGADDWNGALEMAIRINNKELIERFIELGANDWNTALVYAIMYTEDQNLIDRLIELADGYVHAFAAAIKYTNNKDLIERLIRLIPDNMYTRNVGLLAAIESEYNKDMVDRFIELGANNWNDALMAAITTRDEQLIDRFVELGANIWTRALRLAIITKDDKIINKIIDYGIRRVNDNTINWDNAMRFALTYKRDDLVDRFIELGANNWRGRPGRQGGPNSALFEAAKTRDVKTVKKFINLGANNFQQALEASYNNVDKRVETYIKSLF